MATITVVAGRPTIPGEIRWFPEAAGQSFKKGEFVFINMSGQAEVCASDPAGIAGMAEADASGETNKAIPITIAKRGQQFTLHVTNAGSPVATAQSYVGKQYSLYVASNRHYCDVGDSSNKRLVVDDLANDDVVADTNGRVIVEVCKGYAQLDQSTS
jgi:hypothetical protein